MVTINFRWLVCESGYLWERLGDDAILVVGQPWPRCRTEPLVEHPRLFHEFAYLPLNQKAIRQFANQYGHLGDFIWIQNANLDPAKRKETNALNSHLAGTDRPPETLALWKTQIQSMREVVELWERVRAQKVDPDLLVNVAMKVNEQLLDRCVLRMDYRIDGRTFAWDLQPNDLLGALWAQFADALINDRDYRQCRECQKWFELGRGKNWPGKKYCSESCRQKAYRKRKVQSKRPPKAKRRRSGAK